MATCITKQQWAEAYNKEKVRLYKMEAEGFDISDALGDLESMNNSFIEGKAQEARKVARANENKFSKLTSSQIAKVNKNKPKTAKGAKLKVVDGWKDDKDKVTYAVKYPGSDKVYHLAGSAVHLDQTGAKYGVIFGNDTEANAADDVKIYHEELKQKIWDDQGNALELFDHLAALDNNPDIEHNTELKELLTDITEPTKHILNKFKVYLNDEAEKNSGIAVPYGENPRIELNLMAPSNMKSGMSATEMYVHEMLHMSVDVAMTFSKGRVADEISELGRLHELAAQKIEPKDLVENGDTARAERMWNYMFNNDETGLSEFVAYSMTNKTLKNRLKKIAARKEKSDLAGKTVWDKIVFGIVRVYEAIRDLVGKKDLEDSADDRVGKLVSEIWLHNNQTIDDSKIEAGIMNKLSDIQDGVDDKLRAAGTKVASILDKGLDKTEELLEGTVAGTAVKGIRTFGRIINPYASEKSQAVTAAALREFELGFDGTILDNLAAQDGSLMSGINYMKANDDDEVAFVERLGLIAQNIDKYRETTIEQVGSALLKKLDGVGHEGQTALTKALLETDAKSLYGEYSMEEIAKFLSSDEEIDIHINEAIEELKQYESSAKFRNYYIAQSKGLGLFMATGKSGSSLNMNSSEIANMDYTAHWRGGDHKRNDKFKKNEKDIVGIVDKIATLEAIKNTSASARDMTVQVMAEHEEGAKAVLEYHLLHNAKDAMYRDEHNVKTRVVKGQIKDLKAPYVEQIIHRSDEEGKKEMKKEGFRFVDESNVKGYGVYKKYTSGLASFDKQAVSKINEAKEMQNIAALMNRGTEHDEEFGEKGFAEINKITKEAEADITRQMATGDLPTMDGYISMVGKDYKVGNYAVSVDKELYADIMIQDKKAPVLLGKMIAEIQEKDMAGIQNARVMEYIYKDMHDNYTKRGETGKNNQREYIEIGPDANNKGELAKESADRIWRDLPENIKKNILSRRSGYKFMAVRRDMAVMYFGRRAPSLLQARVKWAGNKTVERLLREQGLAVAVESIKLATDIWQEIVGLVKTSIVLKTPIVVINNIASNFNYSWALKQAPWKVAEGQVKMFKATKEYIDMEKKAIGLKLRIDKGENSVENKTALKRLRMRMKENPVHPLVEAGLFTAVLEDLRLRDLQTDTRLGAKIDKYTQKIPSIIRDTASTLFVTQDSQIFSMMMMATTYGDFVARANRYYFLMEQGHTSEQAIKLITDEFVNYNRDLGAAFTWLKNMGFSQFHQYFFGAMKNMAQKIKSHPSSMLAMNLLMGAPNPGDAMPFQRDLFVNIHDPVDILTNQVPEFVANPALLRAVGVTLF